MCDINDKWTVTNPVFQSSYIKDDEMWMTFSCTGSREVVKVQQMAEAKTGYLIYGTEFTWVKEKHW